MKRYLQKIRPWLLRQTGNFKYSNAYYHTKILNRYDNPGAYLALYDQCLGRESFDTKTEINFLEGAEFGASLKKVIPCLPSSPFEILTIESCQVKIIFYKMVIAQHRVKCQIHFFGDSMFLCNYTFSYVKEDEVKNVIGILQKKYLPGIENYSQQVISDPKGGYIYPEIGMELTINYLSTKKEVYEGIKKLKEATDKQKEAELTSSEAEIYHSL